MRHRRRSVSYAGEPFSFELVRGWESEEAKVVWAVSHRGEFIGTMSTPPEITTRDFDMRSAEWLAQLLMK
jgi:hypothetical protein